MSKPTSVNTFSTSNSEHWLVALFRQRSVQLVWLVWAASIILSILLSWGVLPFNRPILVGVPFLFQFINQQVQLAFPLLLMAVTYWITRKRSIPDMAQRAPVVSAVAWAEMVIMLLYGAVILVVGRVMPPLFGIHSIGLHLPGSIYGIGNVISPKDTIVWSIYNFTFYALIPYLVFRSRGYSNEALNLHSANLRNDTLLIVVIFIMEAAFELIADINAGLFQLNISQVAIGAVISFIVHFFGTVLPIMMFIYCILLPRYLKLSGSVATATILGGLTYAGFHLFEYWTTYNTPTNAALSLIFVWWQFFGPGMVKSFLTLRTGNAWIHVWAYHAINPHTTADIPLVIRIFGIK